MASSQVVVLTGSGRDLEVVDELMRAMGRQRQRLERLSENHRTLVATGDRASLTDGEQRTELRFGQNFGDGLGGRISFAW